MSDIKSLQNLLNAVNEIQQKIEAARLCTLFQQTSNNSNASEFHLKFDKLMNKFSEFAEEHRFELNQFHKLILNNMNIIKLKQLQKQNERERLEILKKLETISNCNSEIVDNLSDTNTINHSSAHSAVSVKYESKQDTITTPTPAPISAPANSATIVIPKMQNIRKNKMKNTKKVQKSSKRVQTKTQKMQKSKQTKHKSNTYVNKANNKVNNKVSKNDEYKQHMETPYKYNSSNWSFYGIQKSTSIIFIGNLPKDIAQPQIDYFLFKRGNITISQIIEVRIMDNGRGKYALVRLKNNVSIHKLNRFINKINKENDEIYKEQQINKDKGKINNGFISWTKRIFLKFNKYNKFYKSENEMYNDSNVNHQLFIRNFDILDKNCHYELTCKLLKYGDLYDDIVIKTDHFGDPFCIVTFKYINDAIYCCNADIELNGRILQIKYAKKDY